MSTISAGTTTTTALVQTGDTTGSLVLATGSGATTALTLDSSQNASFAKAVNLPNTFGFKNRIINGGMTIDQRNAGASVTITADGVYTLDRWGAGESQASKFSVQQNAGSVTPPTGYSNYLGATSLAATTVGSTDYFLIYQKIEGFNTADLAFGTANAKTVTLSFQVYSSLTGSFGGSLSNSAQNRSYPFSYTVSTANTWTSITVTIPGDTTGTWIGATNGTGMLVRFSLGSGTTYSGTANAWTGSSFIFAPTGSVNVISTNGATFYITGVQLEVGSQATSFDFRDYGRELILCQRYFVNIPANYEAIAYYSDRLTNGMMFLPVVMRTSPTITGGSWTAHTGNAGTYAGTSATPSYFRQFNSANNWTTGAICTVASAVYASAEL